MYNEISKKVGERRSSEVSEFFPIYYRNNVFNPLGQSIYFGNLIRDFQKVKGFSENAQRVSEITELKSRINKECDLADGVIGETIERMSIRFYEQYPDLYQKVMGFAILRAVLSDKLERREVRLRYKEKIIVESCRKDPSPLRDFHKTAELSSRSSSKTSSG